MLVTAVVAAPLLATRGAVDVDEGDWLETLGEACDLSLFAGGLSEGSAIVGEPRKT